MRKVTYCTWRQRIRESAGRDSRPRQGGALSRGLGLKMVFQVTKAYSMPSTGLEILASGRTFFPRMTKRLGEPKVEKQVHRLTCDCKWNDHSSLGLAQHVPGNELSRCIHNPLTGVDVVGLRRDPASGRPTWFNGLAGGMESQGTSGLWIIPI